MAQFYWHGPIARVIIVVMVIIANMVFKAIIVIMTIMVCMVSLPLYQARYNIIKAVLSNLSQYV